MLRPAFSRAALGLIVARRCRGGVRAIAAAGLARQRRPLGRAPRALERRAAKPTSTNGQLAGSVTLVARRGRIAYFEAFGNRDREANAPMQTDAIFRIASQSKAIVSVAAMTFVEEGKLLLTDPVGKYLPEFMETKVAVAQEGGTGYDVVKARRPITVRDLLTHTSGFGYGNGVGGDLWTAAGQTGYYFADKNETIRDSVRRIASLPAHAQPGTTWIYGYNTDILGALVESRGRQAARPGLARAHLRAARHARHASSTCSPGKANRLTAVYSQQRGKLERAPTPGNAVGQGHYVDGPRKNFSGGAGLLSTATDYARFLQMMLNGGTLDGRRILSRKTVELMTTSHLGDIALQPRPGFRARLLRRRRRRRARLVGLGRRVRLGRRVPHDLLGRSARGARRRAPDAARAGRRRRRSSEGPRARLPSHRGLTAARAFERCAPIAPSSSSSRASA